MSPSLRGVLDEAIPPVCGIGLAALLLILIAAGCADRTPPLPPMEALAKIAARVDEIVRQNEHDGEAGAQSPVTDKPANPNEVKLWVYAHPLATRIAAPSSELPAVFAAENPPFRIVPQYIGDWPVAVQKLTVSLAVDDLPDIALVNRTWLPRLLLSGRIRPIDALMQPEFMKDLLEPARRQFTRDGHVWALPADGFCSVLFYNKSFVGETPPADWDALRTMAKKVSRPAPDPRNAVYAIGDLPFVEMLWSAGIDPVNTRPNAGLRAPQAKDVVDLFLFLRDEEVSYPRALGNPDFAFAMFLKGNVAMTAGPSQWITRCNAAVPAAKPNLSWGIAPLPGKTGPISRLSDSAWIVFARYADAKQPAIARTLEFLTGAALQGSDALAQGSAPTRATIAKSLKPNPGLDAAYTAAQNTPLSPAWSETEYELNHFTGHIYPWIGWRVY
jgi:ABC-type glycerol-3-phosphate transport system substrate-binding protein